MALSRSWRFAILLAFLVLPFIWASKSASADDKEDRPFHGTIARATKVDLKGKQGTQIIRICLVEGIKDKRIADNDPKNPDKVELCVTDKTKVEKLVGKERKAATVEELQKGCKIEFEYSKAIGIMESSPATMYATSIVIHEGER
jgi:hypothetical protein